MKPGETQNKGRKCKYATCPLDAHAGGLCRLHYQRGLYGHPMDMPIRRFLGKAKRLPPINLPADVFDALETEAAARGLFLAEVTREKLTALMRMRAMDRQRAVDLPVSDVWARREEAA